MGAELRLQVREREGNGNALHLLLVPNGQKHERALAQHVHILHPGVKPPLAQLGEALAKHAYRLALAAPLRHELGHGVKKLVQVAHGLEAMKVDQVEQDLWRVFRDTRSIHVRRANATPNAREFGLVGVHAGVLQLLLVDGDHGAPLKTLPPRAIRNIRCLQPQAAVAS
ncbi:hypothetical protein B484DRAFT_39447, partial [Ochromonadaceae sp. CCMP2298]